MFFPKGIRLLLAFALLGSLSVLLTATLNIGKTNAAGGTLRAKLLRRNGQTKLKPTAQELGSLRAQVQPKEERLLENMIPKHVPLGIKIRKVRRKINSRT